MQTKVHRYRFDTSIPAEKEAYSQLKQSIREGRHLFNFLSAPFGKEKDSQPIDGEVLTLETEHLFADQWNTAPSNGRKLGLRVFDWYQPIYPNAHIKDGYYLEMTDEMIQMRRTTLICGYCGKNYPNGVHGTFCEACLDSPYLKEEELHLLRLLPVAVRMPHRDPLTDDERTNLVPKYVLRQTQGADSRAVQRKAKQREDIERKFTVQTQNAKLEHDGMIWLMNHGIEVDNVIFYEHTKVFSFGWRAPIRSQSVRHELERLLKDFPFAFEIKNSE